jgi:hypothetical protein
MAQQARIEAVNRLFGIYTNECERL